jgi:PPOX class probable F420-dependent enzyme
MELREGLAFASERSQGVLVTRRSDGRAQLSNILYHLSSTDDPVVRISVTESRAKTRNLRRDPVASLYVPGASFWTYVVLDGTAELSEVAAAPDDDTVEELVALYRAIRGEDHPDWAEYRAVMVSERRLVARIRPAHAYGITGR